MISDYVVNPTTATTALTFDVATVRKIKRSGEYLSNPSKQNDLILPMQPHSLVLEAALDGNSNGKNVPLPRRVFLCCGVKELESILQERPQIAL